MCTQRNDGVYSMAGAGATPLAIGHAHTFDIAMDLPIALETPARIEAQRVCRDEKSLRFQ